VALSGEFGESHVGLVGTLACTEAGTRTSAVSLAVSIVKWYFNRSVFTGLILFTCMMPLRRTKDFEDTDDKDEDDEVVLSCSRDDDDETAEVLFSTTCTVPELRADATRLATVTVLPNFLHMFFRNLDWAAADVVVLAIVTGEDVVVVLPLAPPFFGVLLRGLYL